MHFKIIKQESKPMVEHDEMLIKIEETNATPSKVQVQEETSKLINKPKELVVVKKISQAFGEQEAIALVYVYNSLDALKKFEPKKKEKKEGEKKQETQQKEEKKSEAKEENK